MTGCVSSSGLKPEINHKNIAEYPPTHPLNPDVNGLHWGWMGGYVFLALEGNWLQPDGRQSGYSYHLATDRQLMMVELPVPLRAFVRRPIASGAECGPNLCRPKFNRVERATLPPPIPAPTICWRTNSMQTSSARLRSSPLLPQPPT